MRMKESEDQLYQSLTRLSCVNIFKNCAHAFILIKQNSHEISKEGGLLASSVCVCVGGYVNLD